MEGTDTETETERERGGVRERKKPPVETGRLIRTLLPSVMA